MSRKATDETAWERLLSMPVAVLGSLNANGTPHLVPFTFARLGVGVLVTAVDEKPKSTRVLRRLENIRRDPRVTILAHHYESDWDRLWWVTASGTATVSETEPPGSKQVLGDRYPQYKRQVLGPWITITVKSLSHWTSAAR